jgi:hypothetical protein
MPTDKGLAFATFDENGDYALQPSTLVKGRDMNFNFADEDGELRIEAYRDTYILYLDGRQITSASFPGSTSSRIALWAQNSPNDREAENYALRFGDIRIESVP